MKQYLLFYGSNYYPRGGVNDLQEDFDSIEEAQESFNKFAKNLGDVGYDYYWYQIVDHSDMKIVKES